MNLIRFRQFWLVLLLALVLPVKDVMATTGSMCHVPDPVGAPAVAADAMGREWSALSPSAPPSHISAGPERPPRSI